MNPTTRFTPISTTDLIPPSSTRGRSSLLRNSLFPIHTSHVTSEEAKIGHAERNHRREDYSQAHFHCKQGERRDHLLGGGSQLFDTSGPSPSNTLSVLGRVFSGQMVQWGPGDDWALRPISAGFCL
ncbi:hypothetical protein CEXT_99361 [Caerostris extrusa]|uniref:Uncharacterized protein n=1 Tax=Caerostris extrusa TaxID=172846 RepID=A0AAV4XHZ3_CAEEX|nr:hypothetical protein CEXT_99361 [Caerostris extrusa]